MLAEHLPDYHLIAPDLAGHGFSGHRPLGTPYYVWDNVSDVLAMADHLELNQFHLVGHSMGAGIASLIAAVAPERVISVALLDGLVPVTTPEECCPQQMVMALRQRQRIASRTGRVYASFDDAVAVRAKSQYPVAKKVAHALVKRSLTQAKDGWRWHTDPYLFAPSVLRLTEGQVAEFLKVIKSPVGLYLAEKGIATEQTHQLANCVTDLELTVFKGGHHFHLEEKPVMKLAKCLNIHLKRSSMIFGQ